MFPWRPFVVKYESKRRRKALVLLARRPPLHELPSGWHVEARPDLKRFDRDLLGVGTLDAGIDFERITLEADPRSVFQHLDAGKVSAVNFKIDIGRQEKNLRTPEIPDVHRDGCGLLIGAGLRGKNRRKTGKRDDRTQ